MGKKNFFEPISGFELPRFAGMPTFMRLPHVGLNHDKITEVDILTKNKIRELNEVSIYPSKHFVTPEESLSDALYDIEEELEKRKK